MTRGLVIGFRGMAGSWFSKGLDALAEKARRRGWEAKIFPHAQAKKAAELARAHSGPLFVMWHSKGAKSSRIFAEALGRPIDAGVSFDAWLPGESPHKHYRRVISVKADKFGRFHMHGGNVVDQVVIPDTTHTTVDDAEASHELVLAELARLDGQTPTSANKPKVPAVTFISQPHAELTTELAVILEPEHETPARTAFYKVFFDQVRGPVFDGGLGQTEIDGCKRLLFIWDRLFSAEPNTTLAFGLSQVRRESPTMQPIREANGKSDAESIRRLEAAWRAGKLPTVKTPYWREGEFGRGDLQVTHLENRLKLDALYQRLFGWNPGFAQDRDRLLDPVLSAINAFAGCIHGTFTGNKVADYDFPAEFAAARAIVNGDDPGDTPAHARAFLAAIEAAEEAAEEAARAVEPAPPVITPLPDPDGELPPEVARYLDHLAMCLAERMTFTVDFPDLPDSFRQSGRLTAVVKIHYGAGPDLDTPRTIDLDRPVLPGTTKETAMNPQGKAALASSGVLGGLLAVIGTVGQIVTGIGGPEAGAVVTQAQGDINQIVQHVSQIATAVGAIVAIIGRWKAQKPITGIFKAAE